MTTSHPRNLQIRIHKKPPGRGTKSERRPREHWVSYVRIVGPVVIIDIFFVRVWRGIIDLSCLHALQVYDQSRSSVCSASRDVCSAAGLLVDSVWSPQQR